jgi:hypothetical protein
VRQRARQLALGVRARIRLGTPVWSLGGATASNIQSLQKN